MGIARDEQGQAVIEYILMLAIVTFGFLTLSKMLKDVKFAERITAPVRNQFAMTYKYGHPKAKGFDEGSPEFHPRARNGGTNFRIFINPGQK